MTNITAPDTNTVVLAAAAVVTVVTVAKTVKAVIAIRAFRKTADKVVEEMNYSSLFQF